MNILADENILLVKEVFSSLGAVTVVPGRDIRAETLGDTDMLLVRTVTRVNRDLLEGGRVRFVASATAGADHVDAEYLARKGIRFVNAPGSNASSVAEYVVAAILHLAEENEIDLGGCSLGIIGVGHVGSRVGELAEGLGMQCTLNDPPLADKTGDGKYRPLEEIYPCRIVTVHTPLVAQGGHPTRHLVDASFLEKLEGETILVNTARGAVVDNAALKAALQGERLKGAVLDVWEGEPSIDVELLQHVAIATPHIAGYSYDGKINGTRQIYEAACRFLHRSTEIEIESLLTPAPVPQVSFDTGGCDQDQIAKAVKKAYDITLDDVAFRRITSKPREERAAYFDHLRKTYPPRREFSKMQMPD